MQRQSCAKELTFARPVEDHIVVKRLLEVAFDLEVVDLDGHSIANVTVAWAGWTRCSSQSLHTHQKGADIAIEPVRQGSGGCVAEKS